MKLIDIKLTDNARVLIDSMPDFPLEEFLKWWKENRMAISSNNVLEYMIIKDSERKKNDNKNS